MHRPNLLFVSQTIGFSVMAWRQCFLNIHHCVCNFAMAALARSYISNVVYSTIVAKSSGLKSQRILFMKPAA